MLAAVPIKPFGAGKGRLAAALDVERRADLSRAVAAHTLRVLAAVGLEVAVVTGDAEISKWATGHGWAVIDDPGTGLNGAAQAAVGAAGGTWAIVHADLPIITGSDAATVASAIEHVDVVLAPAADGGTTVIAGRGDRFPFSYGPGSFARHLAAVATVPHLVVSRAGLALDLDTVADLAAAQSLSDHPWLLID